VAIEKLLAQIKTDLTVLKWMAAAAFGAVSSRRASTLLRSSPS
jgi:hypothetical protein